MNARWTIEDGKWVFYNEDGQKAKGWICVNGKKYWLDEDGNLLMDSWKTIENSTYYFNGTGEAVTGWNWINGYFYYFYEEGHRMCSLARNTIISGIAIDELGRRR